MAHRTDSAQTYFWRKKIGFLRGAGTELARYLAAVAIDAVRLDWTIELVFARDQMPDTPIANVERLTAHMHG